MTIICDQGNGWPAIDTGVAGPTSHTVRVLVEVDAHGVAHIVTDQTISVADINGARIAYAPGNLDAIEP